MPWGDSGDQVVGKRVGAGQPLDPANRNTDYMVDQPFSSYRPFFTETSIDQATNPVRYQMSFSHLIAVQGCYGGWSCLQRRKRPSARHPAYAQQS